MYKSRDITHYNPDTQDFTPPLLYLLFGLGVGAITYLAYDGIPVLKNSPKMRLPASIATSGIMVGLANNEAANRVMFGSIGGFAGVSIIALLGHAISSK